ncbi:MAG: thermonuclease family protein, partial [Candidatus Gracilibacteria bacterium]|nr:thermonuclease family protein [Candidatus Gracilibacteria bacterium]
SEWAEITNPLGVDVSLAGCTLDDDIGKGSHPYDFQDTAVVRANSIKRYYKLQTLLNFNNTGDSANLMCGEQLVSSLSWDYSVPEGFIVSGKKGPYSENVRVKVLRVVDGDTIVVELYGKQEKVRLIGVDTPETVDPRKNVQYFGIEASNYTKKMLTGKEVELEFDYNPRDKYDRLLTYVWIDGQNYNKELIRLGYARAYLRFPFRYFKEFEKIGKEAEKNKVGLWSDPEVKKLLDAEAKEDKKALEEQLREEDVAILDDLIEIAEDPEIASDKLDAEFLDRLLDVEDDDPISKKKYTTLRKVLEKIQLQSIEIQLQGLTSSKNRHLAGNVFTCSTKTTCSVNFTAGKVRKDTIYFWDFGDSETFYGANPKSLKFGIGTYKVSLRVLDTLTGEIHDSYFTIIVHRLVTIKKPKKPKVAKVKVEKPLSVRLNNFFSNSSLSPIALSPLDTAKSSTALAFVFFSGVHIILRKKKIIL